MLRILSLNLNYRVAKHGAWPERRALIARTARAAQVDVMALQAVEGAGGSNQAAELAALLGFAHVAFVAATRERDVARGSAFVSRCPLIDLAVRQLGHRGDHEDKDRRLVLKARIATRAGDVDLYNAHFSWVGPQALDNARETLGFAAPGRALLLGDLNSSPDSAALGRLRRAGWADMWEALHPADPGFTFEADQPAQRIDYALAGQEARARVRAVERLAANGRGAPRLSDHLGVLVELEDLPVRTV